MSEAPSATIFVMGARLPWPDDAPAIDDKGPFDPAISARGLQLEGDALPSAGTYVSVLVEGLNIPAGEIAWRKADLAGIALLDELSWSSIMPWIRDLVRKQAL